MTSFKTLVSKKANAWQSKRTQGDKKQCLPVITWNKKHLSKKVIPIIYPMEEFFAVGILKVCESGFFFFFFFLMQSKKPVSILWFMWVFFAFVENRRPNKYYLGEVNFVYIKLDVSKCKFIMKNCSLKCWLFFWLFSWWTQK